MKKKIFALSAVAAVPAGMLAMGCSAEAPVDDEVSAAVDVDGVEEQATITNVNGDGTWTATANAPFKVGKQGDKVRTTATFTGPAGKVRGMGVCLLRLPGSGGTTYQACSTDATCPNAPGGGSKYCQAIDGVGQKYCWIRPGSASNWCAGSPVTGGPVAPGTYYTPSQYINPNGAVWIGRASMDMCNGVDPSVSSDSRIIESGPGCTMCGSVCC